MAMTDEQSRWNEWNDGVENRAASGSIDYVDDIMETFDSNDDPPRRTSFCQKIQPPQVSHIEQAERLTVHSCLHHHSVIPSSSAEQSDNSSGGNQPSNDFSHLPAPHENNVVCLWMTNVLELLDLPERHLDRKCMCANEQNCKCQLRLGRGKFHGDMHPYRPLQLPDLNVVNEIWKDMENKMSDSLYSEKVSNDDPNHGASPKSQSAWSRIVDSANPHPDLATPTPIEQHQLAFSFRANLPPDIPPTMSAECVKYFYSAVLVVTTVEGEVGLVQTVSLTYRFILLTNEICSSLSPTAPSLSSHPTHGTILTNNSHTQLQQHEYILEIFAPSPTRQLFLLILHPPKHRAPLRLDKLLSQTHQLVTSCHVVPRRNERVLIGLKMGRDDYAQ